MIVNGDPEQKRSTFTPDQLEALEQAFNRGHYPTDPFNRDNMSNKVDLSQTRVQVNTVLHFIFRHFGSEII